MPHKGARIIIGAKLNGCAATLEGGVGGCLYPQMCYRCGTDFPPRTNKSLWSQCVVTRRAYSSKRTPTHNVFWPWAITWPED